MRGLLWRLKAGSVEDIQPLSYKQPVTVIKHKQHIQISITDRLLLEMTFTTQIKSKEQLSLVSKLIKISAFKKDLEFDFNLYKKRGRKDYIFLLSLLQERCLICVSFHQSSSLTAACWLVLGKKSTQSFSHQIYCLIGRGKTDKVDIEGLCPLTSL